MPSDSDQKKAVLTPFDAVLPPDHLSGCIDVAGPAVLCPYGSRGPPSRPRQQSRRAGQPSGDAHGTHVQIARSPMPFAPRTAPGRSSSCSIRHCPATDIHRTGTPLGEKGAIPPTIVPSRLTAKAPAELPSINGGRSTLQLPDRHTAAVAMGNPRVPTTIRSPAPSRAVASTSLSLQPSTSKPPVAGQRMGCLGEIPDRGRRRHPDC